MLPNLSRRLLVIAITTFIFLLLCLIQFPRSDFAGIAPAAIPLKQKYAYCTFLAPSPQATGNTLYDEDHYFAGVRMLIYQLLHDPATRTNCSIPVVVLVTTDIPQSSRDRLIKDGARVVEVNPLNFGWIKPGRERWMRVMDKLHAFELVEYEKVLLLDSDIVVVKPLDAIFNEDVADVLQNVGKADKRRPDEYPQPSSYLLAGNSESRSSQLLNAGFVLLQPSMDMYNHYLSVAAIEGRFNGSSPEQDLWNYVHRPEGNMPWTQIPKHWSANSPWYRDYENGTASFHEKYWGCGRDQKMRGILLKSRFEMEGFFQARDELK